MPNPTRCLLSIFTFAMINVSIVGCAQKTIVQSENAPQIVISPKDARAPQSAIASQAVYAPQDMSAPQKWNAPQKRVGLQKPNGSEKWNAQNQDCRSCHAANGVAGAKDFSPFYANPGSHHPVGVKYPLAAQGGSNFQLPEDQNNVVSFFDRNGNGQPDSDEVMLFGANGAETVQCASCHVEHGSSPAPVTNRHDFYLRVANVSSALCITCHRL
jgi:hypothetical protein